MEFRKATAEDIPLLVDMRVLYSLETYDALTEAFEKRMRAELPEYFLSHLGKDLAAYIALENGVAVSTALLLQVEKPINPALVNGKSGVVLNVFTKPEYRRKKIASKLMQKLLSDAKQGGLDYVELKATKSGYPLYKKLGFTEKSENVYMICNFGR